MGVKRLRTCPTPGCPGHYDGEKCTHCGRTPHRTNQQRCDSRRGSAAARGYGRRWRKASKQHLLKHPLCVECERQGRLTPATLVDHIRDHKGDRKLFWDQSNWQSLCKPCHDRKPS